MADGSPKFRIILNVPHFDDRDRIRGWTRRTVGTAMTKGWAFKLAADHDGLGMDETFVQVMHRDGYRVFSDAAHKQMVWDNDRLADGSVF